MHEHNTIGAYMAGRRRLRALKQADVAVAAGVTRPTLSSWEADKTSPSTAQLTEWIKALGLTDEERSDVASLVLGPFDIGGTE